VAPLKRRAATPTPVISYRKLSRRGPSVALSASEHSGRIKIAPFDMLAAGTCGGARAILGKAGSRGGLRPVGDTLGSNASIPCHHDLGSGSNGAWTTIG
jgi:hypothetical protein